MIAFAPAGGGGGCRSKGARGVRLLITHVPEVSIATGITKWLCSRKLYLVKYKQSVATKQFQQTF